MNTSLPYILEIDNQEVIVMPDPQHEFTATTEQVALGYGVSIENIRQHKLTKDEELVEGKHWFAVSNPNAAGTVTLWTKRGIIRLGFFIRSVRARKFRDMAEDLVLGDLEKNVIPASTPALISARQIAETLGSSISSTNNRIAHRGIKPTHHFTESRGSLAFLYPLEHVQAVWPNLVFPVFQGKVLPGVAPIMESLTVRAQTKSAKSDLPVLLPTPTRTETLARRLLGLEAERRAIFAELAASA